MPPRSRRNPLLDYLTEQGKLDRALRKELRGAAGQGKLAVERAVRRGIAADRGILYRSVRLTNRELWGRIGILTKEAIPNVMIAGTKEIITMDELLGVTGRKDETEAQARKAANDVVSRRINGHSLSGRVYRSGLRANGYLSRIIDQAIREQVSAQTLANRIRDSIRPDVPGGVSYAAMRLARTELNNAFHLSQIRSYEDRGYVIGVRWHLSEDHPRPDECNDFAAGDHVGLGSGVFTKTFVPAKPHPQCFCYLTAVIDRSKV